MDFKGTHAAVAAGALGLGRAGAAKPAAQAASVSSIIAEPMLNGDGMRLDGAIRMATR